MLNLSLRKWTKVQVDAFRKAQSGKALSYDFPMITFDFKPVKGWNFDVQKAEVGEGQATFDFLKPQLLQWKQFPLGWTTYARPSSASRLGPPAASM